VERDVEERNEATLLVRSATGNGLPNVVVTGVAMTTATDVDTTWKLVDGQSGIRKLDAPFIEQFHLPVRSGEHLLEDFDSQLTRVELRRFLFLQKMSTIVARRVWVDAGARGGHHPADGFHRQPGWAQPRKSSLRMTTSANAVCGPSPHGVCGGPCPVLRARLSA
jgi:hypothetical protein